MPRKKKKYPRVPFNAAVRPPAKGIPKTRADRRKKK
jgi:hypothetical protein